MSQTYTMSLTQGDSFSVSVTAKNAAGTPINLSGYSLTGQIKTKYSDSSVLLGLAPTITNSGSGVFSISLSAIQTSGLPTSLLVYDVEATTPSGTVTKLLKGYCEVSPEVTK